MSNPSSGGNTGVTSPTQLASFRVSGKNVRGNPKITVRVNLAKVTEVVGFIIQGKRRDFINLVTKIKSEELLAILRAPVDYNVKEKDSKDKDKNNKQQQDRDVDPTNLWWTPLHLMAYYDRIEMLSMPAVENLVRQHLGGSSTVKEWSVFYDGYERLPLSYAVERGNFGVIRYFCRCSIPNNNDNIDNVRRKSSISAIDLFGCSALHYAAKHGSKSMANDIVQHLLSSGADTNICNNEGDSPLATATLRSNHEVVLTLLKGGADSDLTLHEDKWTPLILAAYKGYFKIVEILLEPPDNLPPANALALTKNGGATALIVAAINGHSIAVEKLLQSDAGLSSINVQDTYGRTALSYAAFRGFEEIVDILLARQADTSLADELGATPLMLAIVGENPDGVVPKFLDYGVDVNAKDINGWSPVMIAADRGRTEVTKSLLAKVTQNVSSVVNSQMKDGTTAVIIAAAAGNERLLDQLLVPQAIIDAARPLDDWSALFHATYNRSLKCTRLLINHLPHSTASGALGSLRIREINRGSSFTGLTPLLIASLFGSTTIVRALIDAGALVNAADKSSFTSLMAAVQNNNEGLARLLIAKGAAIDCQEENGYTALSIASFLGFPKVVEMLLVSRASPFIPQVNGRTPLILSAERGYSEIVRLITKRHPSTVCDVDRMHRTALHYGVMSGDERTVAALCQPEMQEQTHMDPNAQDLNGITPLMIAASRRQQNSKPPEKDAKNVKSSNEDGSNSDMGLTLTKHLWADTCIVPLLNLKKLDLDLRDNEGDTALIKAFLAENWPVAEALIRKRASASLVRLVSPRLPPVSIAALGGHTLGVKMIKHLAPGDVNIPDAFGQTALFHASSKGLYGIVDLLLNEPAPAKVDAIAKIPHNGAHEAFEETTPLHIVALQGTAEIAERLIAGGANTDFTNSKGETATMLAAGARNWDVFEVLVARSKYADLECRDKNGQAVLHRLCALQDQDAACKGFRIIVKYHGITLLDTITDKPHNNTVLHLAAIYEKPVLVNELIILGVSRTVKNAFSQTPAQSIAHGPTVFDELGRIIGGNYWQEMAELLLKKVIQEKYVNENGDDDDGVVAAAVEARYQQELRELEHISSAQKRAADVFERFYELSRFGWMDFDTILAAWDRIKDKVEDERLRSQNTNKLIRLKSVTKGKHLVFNESTYKNLVKVRSSFRNTP